MSELTEHGLLPNRAGEAAHREIHERKKGQRQGAAECKALAEAVYEFLTECCIDDNGNERKRQGAATRVPWDRIDNLGDAFDQWAISYFGGVDRVTF